MEQVELGWDEFWAEIFRIRLRDEIVGIQEYDRMVTDFCVEALHLRSGDRLLDMACGAGNQSILLAKMGMQVTAFDISRKLVQLAEQAAKDAGAKINFYCGDMREMKNEKEFRGVILLSHSFGFFHHEENKRVVKRVFNALADGGRFLLDLMNPFSLPRFQKTWTKIEGGYLLSEPHVVDAQAGVLRGRPATFIDEGSARIVLMNKDAMSNNNIRLYTPLEIHAMLKEVGFSRIEMYGQNKLPRTPYCSDSDRMVVVATR
jgi:2-polyprenyl-3-methyl-5-hydroxy-6-metoxy-1,4-benzoquinol methylase